MNELTKSKVYVAYEYSYDGIKSIHAVFDSEDKALKWKLEHEKQLHIDRFYNTGMTNSSIHVGYEALEIE